jgi:hypothetical protein
MRHRRPYNAGYHNIGLPAGPPACWDEVTERPCPECDGEMDLKRIRWRSEWVCACGHTIDPRDECEY